MNIEYVKAKTIVTKAKSEGWFGTNYNMNIYRGCSHGCIYCDSRSDCYRIEKFDNVKVKEDALKIIRNELRKKVKKGVIGTGAMSDPYNTLENKLKLTGNALELINAFGFGVAIDTKSPLITRDIEVLKDIKKHSPVIVKLTITTWDDELSKLIEPNLAASSQRFEALKELSANGIYCGILLMPILPFINDTEKNLVEIIKMAEKSGAKFIYPFFGVTLRDVQRQYYYNQLDEKFPEMVERYKKTYGNRYSCTSPKSKTLYGILQEECNRAGILNKMSSIIYEYKRPYYHEQLSFF